jgi:predicted amidophosphoribosyltransferase
VLITHIPSSDPKQGNLTSLLAGHAHEHIDAGKRPVSSVEMKLSQKKDALKALDLERKRMEWERLFEAGAVSISDSVDDATVVVVDDLYQSGTTMWSFARYLKQQGARHVLGLVCVKTLRDTDNL